MLAAADHLMEAITARHKDKTAQRLQDALAADVRKAFKRQLGAFLTRLEQIRAWFPTNESLSEAGALPDWEGPFDMAALETLQAFTGPLAHYIQLALLAGHSQALATAGFGLSFDLPFPDAVNYASERAATLVASINDVTRTDVRRLVTQAVDEGQSYGQLAKSLREKYAQFSVPRPQLHIKDRAEGIAVTEIGNAYEAGNEQVGSDLQAAGLTMQKSWLTVGDDRVDGECMDNQDAGWIPFEDSYPSGHMRPLAHPYCRCTQLIRRKPDG